MRANNLERNRKSFITAKLYIAKFESEGSPASKNDIHVPTLDDS